MECKKSRIRSKMIQWILHIPGVAEGRGAKISSTEREIEEISVRRQAQLPAKSLRYYPLKRKKSAADEYLRLKGSQERTLKPIIWRPYNSNKVSKMSDFYSGMRKKLNWNGKYGREGGDCVYKAGVYASMG